MYRVSKSLEEQNHPRLEGVANFTHPRSRHTSSSVLIKQNYQ